MNDSALRADGLDLDRATSTRPRAIGARDRDRHGLHEPLRLSRSGAAWTGVKDTGRGARCRCRLRQLTGRNLHLREIAEPDASGRASPRAAWTNPAMDANGQDCANWNYPTTVRFGAGRIAELGEACAAPASRGRCSSPIPAWPSCRSRPRRSRCSPRPACRRGVLRGQAQPGRGQRRRPGSRPASGGHDGVVAFGGGSALDAGKLVAFMAGQTRPMWDFEDIGDWWTRADAARSRRSWRCRRRPAPARRSAAPACITNEATHTKKMIFHPKMLPAVGDLRSGADRRHAAGHHRRHRHGRAGALPRGLLRAGLSPDGRRHRGRRHAALQGVPAARLCRRPRPRGAGQHAGGRGDGRHGLPERAGRDPRAVASGRRALRHPSRPDQRGVHALRARLQPRGGRSPGSSGSPPIAAFAAASMDS